MTSKGPCHLASNLELEVGSNTSTLSPGAKLRSLVPRLYSRLCLSWAYNKYAWRAAPRCGVLFSGPAHAEFRSCSPKVPPPTSLSGRPKPRGAGAHKGARRGKTLWRLAGHLAQRTKGVFVNKLSNHCFQCAIKSFHQAVRL